MSKTAATHLARLRENLIDIDAALQAEEDWYRLVELFRLRRHTLAALQRVELREVRRG